MTYGAISVYHIIKSCYRRPGAKERRLEVMNEKKVIGYVGTKDLGKMRIVIARSQHQGQQPQADGRARNEQNVPQPESCFAAGGEPVPRCSLEKKT